MNRKTEYHRGDSVVTKSTYRSLGLHHIYYAPGNHLPLPHLSLFNLLLSHLSLLHLPLSHLPLSLLLLLLLFHLFNFPSSLLG